MEITARLIISFESVTQKHKEITFMKGKKTNTAKENKTKQKLGVAELKYSPTNIVFIILLIIRKPRKEFTLNQSTMINNNIKRKLINTNKEIIRSFRHNIHSHLLFFF